jgi:hypothetical protein
MEQIAPILYSSSSPSPSSPPSSSLIAIPTIPLPLKSKKKRHFFARKERERESFGIIVCMSTGGLLPGSPAGPPQLHKLLPCHSCHQERLGFPYSRAGFPHPHNSLLPLLQLRRSLSLISLNIFWASARRGQMLKKKKKNGFHGGL